MEKPQMYRIRFHLLSPENLVHVLKMLRGLKHVHKVSHFPCISGKYWKIFIERYNFQLNLLNIPEVLYKKKIS